MFLIYKNTCMTAVAELIGSLTPPVFHSLKEMIRDNLKEKYIQVGLHKTTDPMGRAVINVITGSFDAKDAKNHFWFACHFYAPL